MSIILKQYCHRQLLEHLCGGLPEELIPQGRPVHVSKTIAHGHSSIESVVTAILNELHDTGFEMPRQYIEMTGAAQKDILRGVAEALIIYGAVTLVSAPPGNRYVPELAPFTPYYWFYGVFFIYDWTEAEINEQQLETTIWHPPPFSSSTTWKGVVIAHEAFDCGVTWDAQQILEYAVWAEHVRNASGAAKKPKKPTVKPSQFRMISADQETMGEQQAWKAQQTLGNANPANHGKGLGAQGGGNASFHQNAFKDENGLRIRTAPTHWSAVEVRDAAWTKNSVGLETKTWWDPGTFEPFTFDRRVTADVVLKLAELFNLPEVAKLVRWRKEMKINRLKRVQCGYCNETADLGSYLPPPSAQSHASNPSNLIPLGHGANAVREFVYHFRTRCKPGSNINIYVPFAKFPVHQCTCGKLFWCHEEVEECAVRHG